MFPVLSLALGDAYTSRPGVGRSRDDDCVRG